MFDGRIVTAKLPYGSPAADVSQLPAGVKPRLTPWDTFAMAPGGRAISMRTVVKLVLGLPSSSKILTLMTMS
jgi:hypothetical protein